MPDFDRMMYQTPYWRSATMGRDLYVPGREPVTHGQVARHVLPEWGERGWAQVGYDPANPDPYLTQQGYQQTGIFGGPGGRAETYVGPQGPGIATPIGFDKGFDGRPRRALGSIPAPVVQVGVLVAAAAAVWKLWTVLRPAPRYRGY